MTRRSTVAPIVGLLAVLAFGGVARTDPTPPPNAPAADALAQKETAARGKAADEMAALAKSCAGYSAADDARQAYYRAAATLACYLLEGKERAYRAQFVKLLETVHQAHEDSGTFAASFEGVDVKALDAEFRAYCSAIVLDAR